MKSILSSLLIVLLLSTAIAQPHGNGHGNGNGGNGNNGNGNGGCANPPCGGPNSVPIDTEWLLAAGLITGCYLKFLKNKRTKV